MTHRLNKVMLIGRLGRDPEMRYTAQGDPVTTFSVATSSAWVTPEGETREAVDWFNVVAWRGMAEACHKTLRKDARVFIEGRLQSRTWVDEQGGQQHRTEIVVADMIPLDDEPSGAGDPTAGAERADLTSEDPGEEHVDEPETSATES